MSEKCDQATTPGMPADPELTAACRRLAESGLLPIVAIGEPRLYAAKDLIFKQGDPPERFLVVAFGSLKAYFEMEEGRCVIVGLHGAGDVVGFDSALADRCHRVSVLAFEKSGCLLVDRQRVFELFARRPELIAELFPRLARCLVSCTRCLAESSCYRVETRFARLFLYLLADHGSNGGDGIWIPLPLSRQDLAELTGTTIETCSRVMSRWRRDGIVMTADDGFRVRDRAALREIALA